MDTIAQLIDTLTAISVIIVAGSSFIIVGIAGISAIRAKTVRWDALGFTLVILWLIPIGFRVYGVVLMQAATDGADGMLQIAPDFRMSMRNLVSGVAEPWDENGNDAPVTISQPTPQFTSTPMPTTDNHFEATATAFFEGTAEPTATPRPMIEPTRTPIPSPTVFLCRSTEDILAGCQPPTPIPGN